MTAIKLQAPTDRTGHRKLCYLLLDDTGPVDTFNHESELPPGVRPVCTINVSLSELQNITSRDYVIPAFEEASIFGE